MDDSNTTYVALQTDGETSRLYLRDGIGIETINEFHALACRAVELARPVHVDASELGFLDTATVQVLLCLRQLCASRGIPFSTVAHDPAVQNALRGGGLGDLFPAAE